MIPNDGRDGCEVLATFHINNCVLYLVVQALHHSADTKYSIHHNVSECHKIQSAKVTNSL